MVRPKDTNWAVILIKNDVKEAKSKEYLRAT